MMLITIRGNPEHRDLPEGAGSLQISQSLDNYVSNSQPEHLKKMGISKSHDDVWV